MMKPFLWEVEYKYYRHMLADLVTFTFLMPDYRWFYYERYIADAHHAAAVDTLRELYEAEARLHAEFAAGAYIAPRPELSEQWIAGESADGCFCYGGVYKI